jgi:anthranilate synthase component 2
MSRPRILVIDNYDSFTWNLVHYIEELGGDTQVVRNDELSVDEALELKPSGVLLSPGPCTPNEAGICVELVRQAPLDLPILGVCLGHQSIAQAYEASVGPAVTIRHGKLSTIEHSGGPLFEGLPTRFDVVRYHSLAVELTNLPACLVADARADDGCIMALRHQDRPIYGVQFHPESIKTEHGHALLKNWLELI